MRDDQVKLFRLDIPTISGRAVYYFFVPRDSGSADPWWNHLVSYLLRIGPRQPHGTSAETGAPMETATIAGEERSRLLELLRTAPEREAQAHRTLQRALELLPMTDRPLQVVYFGEETSRGAAG